MVEGFEDEFSEMAIAYKPLLEEINIVSVSYVETGLYTICTVLWSYLYSRNTVVEGLQDELSAMAIAYKPLEEMNIKLQRSLEEKRTF